ncbi:MAG: ribonuclease III [Clostridiales bacterium]|jgi:ribonuclease-3 family protein|nr:ribonuclease III [Clostridiales bacterium]
MMPEELSPLPLAYLGDAVFELMVRELLVTENGLPVGALQQKAQDYVSASAQSRMYWRVCETLRPEEQAVLKRGRNAKTGTKAKHAAMMDYQHATGLEALFGYLFLKGDFERLKTVFTRCVTKEAGGC